MSVGVSHDDSDLARHRASAVRWLRQRGYHSLAQARRNLEARAVTAGLREEDLMPEPRVNRPQQHGNLELRWLQPGEQPPKPRRPAPRYEGLIAELRRRPGVWADLGEAGSGIQTSLRKHGAQVAARLNGTPGKSVVYARWPPEG